MECKVSQGGCVGSLWTLVKAVCPFQTVTAMTGMLDDNNHLFTSDTILGSFNISRGLIMLPTECSAEQANILRTQYAKLFIHLAEHPLMLQTLQKDVDLEVQMELIEDSVARLQKVVGGFLRRSLEVSACQARAAAQWSQLTASGEPGKYLIRAGGP